MTTATPPLSAEERARAWIVENMERVELGELSNAINGLAALITEVERETLLKCAETLVAGMPPFTSGRDKSTWLHVVRTIRALIKESPS